MGTEVLGEFMERLGPPPPLKSQEAQPHFSSARVPFRPLEPGPLGRLPCGRARGTHVPVGGHGVRGGRLGRKEDAPLAL